MPKPTIAIDIDDVIADSTENLRKEVNKRLGVDLQPKDYAVPGRYWGYYEEVWKKHGLADRISFEDLDPQMVEDQSHVQLIEGVQTILRHLSKDYDLVVVTARNIDWEPATKRWLSKHFDTLFKGMYFAGHHLAGPQTKGKLCKEIGAEWLIDDNIEHAHTAQDEGIKVVLFGDYGWHQNVVIHNDVVRCKDWPAVLEYFDGQRD